jgi:hypothetical protein
VRGKIIAFNRDEINTYLGHSLTLAGNMRCEYRAKETINDWDLAVVNAHLCLEGRTYDLNDQGFAKSWKRENLNLEARAYLVL